MLLDAFARLMECLLDDGKKVYDCRIRITRVSECGGKTNKKEMTINWMYSMDVLNGMSKQ